MLQVHLDVVVGEQSDIGGLLVSHSTPYFHNPKRPQLQEDAHGCVALLQRLQPHLLCTKSVHVMIAVMIACYD